MFSPCRQSGLAEREPVNLQNLCVSAAETGRSIDLSGCIYGPHRRSQRTLGIQSYYSFLAGFVRHLHLRKILEIGTGFGGSMMALHRGCEWNQPGVELVTIDKFDAAGEGLIRLREVQRIHGDSLATSTLYRTRMHLSVPIDLLYIDSKCSYDHARRNIAIFGCCFHPRFIILDDIHLNAEMETLWSEIHYRYGSLAYDASEVAERPSGFGILACAAKRSALAEERHRAPDLQATRPMADAGYCQSGR